MTYMESHSVDGLEIDDQKLMVSIKNVPIYSGILIEFMEKLSMHAVNVDVITQTAPIKGFYDVSFIVKESSLTVVNTIANKLGENYSALIISINRAITCLSVSGIGMRTQSGVAAKLFEVLSQNDVRILMVTTSEIRITCVIKEEDAIKAAIATKKAFDIL